MTNWATCEAKVDTVWADCDPVECVGTVATFTAPDSTPIDGVSYIPEQGTLNGFQATIESNQGRLEAQAGPAWISTDVFGLDVQVKIRLVNTTAIGLYVTARESTQGSTDDGAGIAVVGTQDVYWFDVGSGTLIANLSADVEYIEFTLIGSTLSWVFRDAGQTILEMGSQTVTAAGPGTLVNARNISGGGEFDLTFVDDFEACALT